MVEGRLDGIRACVFDAYGTLFDYASAAARCRDVLGDRIERLTVLWRDKQLQYTWLRTLQGRHADFWQVTGDALDFALDTLGIDDAALRERLAPGCGALGRGGRGLQDPSKCLSACRRSARHRARRHQLPIVQCLGRACGVRLRDAGGLVQPLRPAPR